MLWTDLDGLRSLPIRIQILVYYIMGLDNSVHVEAHGNSFAFHFNNKIIIYIDNLPQSKRNVLDPFPKTVPTHEVENQ